MATATNSQVLLGLYAAIYVRSPDKGGYDFWMNGFSLPAPGTLTLRGAATAFSARTEWATAYPSTMTTAAYVDKIYLNVLGIAGDAKGRAFWTTNIDAGAYSRPEFVAEFIKATIEYDSVADTTSTAAEKTSAVGAQTTINSKVSFSEAWIASPAATNAGLTGVDSAGNYVAANDKSVALLAGVSDAATLATQVPLITAAAAAGSTFTLTTAGDTLTTLTALNDTVTGAAGTLGTNDVIVDTTTTDADVLTAAGVAAGTAPKISSVETLNISNNFATGLDLANVTGTTALNLSATLANGNAVVTNAKMAAATTITAGTNIAELSVSTNSKGTVGSVAINAGTATKVTLTGSAAVDTLALTTTGDVTIVAGAGTDKIGTIEALTLTANAAAGTGTGTATAATAVVTLASDKALLIAGVDAAFSVAGTSNVELKADVLALDGRTVTKATTGTLTATLGQLTPPTAATTYDLSKVAATTFNVGADLGALATLKLEHGSNVSTTATQTNLAITNASQIGLTNTAATQTKFSSDTVKALTLTSNAPILTGVDVTYGEVDLTGNTATVTNAPNLTGSVLNLLGGTAAATQDVKVAIGKVETVDASKLVGTVDYSHNQLIGAVDATLPTVAVEKFTFTGSVGADKLTIAAPATATNVTAKANITATLGDGDDTLTLPGIKFVTGSTLKIDGGAGTADTLRLSANADVSAATLTLTAVENIGLGGKATFSAAQLTGQAYNIQGSIALDDLTIQGVAATVAIDATALKLNSAVETLTIDGSKGSAGQTLKGFASSDIAIKTTNVITGGNFGDTITGGSADDKITGGKGTDNLSGGQGADIFYVGVGESGVASSLSFDTINDFTKVATLVAGPTQTYTDKIVGNGITLTAAPVVAPVAADVTTTAAISINGVATFDVTTSTPAARYAAANKALGTAPAGASVVWAEGADTFLLVNGTTDADDTLVKLAGVSLGTGGLASFVEGITFASTTATTGDDNIPGTPQGDVVNALSGNDILNTGANGAGVIDNFTGGPGNDTFNVTAGTANILDFGTDADVLNVSLGATALATFAVTAPVFTATAATTNAGTLTLNTMAGTTTATVDLSAITTNTGTININAATASGITTLKAGAGKHSITGGAGVDNITGGAGADTIYGGTGAAVIDVLLGGAGDDVFKYSVAEFLNATNAVIDSVDGGDGVDAVLFTDTGGFTIAEADILTRIQNVEKITVGVNSAAISIKINATGQAPTVGSDFKFIDLSGDTDATGTNIVSITGAIGIDSIVGSAGIDQITLGAAASAVTIVGGAGADTLDVGTTSAVSVSDVDGIVITNTTNVVSSISITSALVATSITGGTGIDTITLAGGVSNVATVTGGAGNDIINLGAAHTGGVKVVLGTAAAAGADTITNFVVGLDDISLSDGTFAFTGSAGDATLGTDFVSVANAAALTGGSVAGSTNVQKIIFLQDTGALYHNTDAATAGGLTLIGTLASTALSATDFVITA